MDLGHDEVGDVGEFGANQVEVFCKVLPNLRCDSLVNDPTLKQQSQCIKLRVNL